MVADVVLLERWRQGDLDAARELFEHHFDSLYRFFDRKVGGATEDLVQRTLLACVESRDRIQEAGSFRAFLFGIARNELLAFWRREKRTRTFEPMSSSVEDLSPTPTSALAHRGEQRLLLEALRSIPIDLQVALELHYWEHLSGPELARVLDIPEGTVRSRLRRGIEMLRQRIGEIEDAAEQLTSTMQGLDEWAAMLKDVGSSSKSSA